MNEGAMELLRECRLLIIRLRNEARTGTGRDTISRIDALLAQSKAAPESKCVWLIERGQQENHSPTIWWRAAAWESLPYAGQWTEDANQARHFLTADEAHHCALVHVKHSFRIVEHVFLKAAPQITESARAGVAEATRTSASEAPDSGEGMPEEPYVIGDTACPAPTLPEAVLAIAAHIELDATEEAQQEAAVLRQAATALSLREKREPITAKFLEECGYVRGGGTQLIFQGGDNIAPTAVELYNPETGHAVLAFVGVQEALLEKGKEHQYVKRYLYWAALAAAPSAGGEEK